MTAWLVLLVPALLLPIVLLFAFVGCSGEQFVATEPTTPQPQDPSPQPQDPRLTPPRPTGPPSARAPYGDVITRTLTLAAYWPLSERAGATARDLGPLGLPGTYTGGVQLGILGSGALVLRDPDDTAPHFDGTSAWVEVLFNGQLNRDATFPFSFEAWVKPEGDPFAWKAEQAVVSSHELVGNREHGFELSVVHTSGTQPAIRGRVFTGLANPAYHDLSHPLPTAPDTWRFLVLTYDGAGTLTLYIDSVDQTATGVSFQPNAGQSLRIGADRQPGADPTAYFAGHIAQVALYQSALSQQDVNNHFAAARP